MFNVSKKSKNILAFVYVIGLLLFATIYSQSEQSRNRMPGQPQFLPTVIPSEMVMPTEPVPTPTPLPPEYEVPVLQTVNPHREANELPVSYIKDGEVWVSSFDGNYSEQVTFSNGHIGL
ncbi:hypothetical protein KC573_04295, partial [candidate division WWE3 bacterium]|nr:hypothetical protein [candidate division WWE3 bacterium]